MAERELEMTLNERAKLKSSVVGVGFAGSFNAQQVHQKLEIPAFIVNSSIKDLSDGIIDKNIPSFIIGRDGRGAGNDRIKSKEMFKSNGRKLLESTEGFVHMVSDSDIIFVIFSTAGGTGSGTGPDLVKFMRKMNPQKIVIPIVIAPKSSDSSLSQYNNLECINELDALGGPYCIGDLNYFLDENDNVAYEKMSSWVVETVQKLSGMEMLLSDSGMMDENDLSNVISEKGYMVQYTIEVKSTEAKDIQDMLLAKMASSPAMMIQKDRHVTWGGLIVNIPSEIDDPVRTGNLSKIFQSAGEPKHVYKNYAVSKSTKGTVTLILSGMSLPYNRLSESTTKVKEYLKTSVETQRNISLGADLAELSSDDVTASFRGFTRKTSNHTQEDDEALAAELGDFFD